MNRVLTRTYPILLPLLFGAVLAGCGSTANQSNNTARASTNTQQQSQKSHVCLNRTLAPVQNATRCLELANQGNADAMWMLGHLLSRFGPDPKNPNDHHKMNQWKDIGNKEQAIVWYNQAAKAGSVDAIKYKCSLKDDPKAPAYMRSQALRWCELLK